MQAFHRTPPATCCQRASLCAEASRYLQACTATTATLDSAGNVGNDTSVTVGADGLGLISYYDSTNGDLKVAHCADTFCVPYLRRR